ncbi:MAG: complex I NDUFA9 subunit family protein [Acuticoccus sp.]
MQEVTGKLVTVFGGSGFIGRYLVRALARDGWRVRVAVRRPDLVGYLQPAGGVGQIKPIYADVQKRDSVRAAVAHADAVVNLVGILAESGKQSFDGVQAQGAAHIAEAAREAGITRLVQMSAIGADAGSGSKYAQTKAAGEEAAFGAVPGAIVLRPSLVFGPEDALFNRFARIAALSPFVPVVGPDSRFQPVYVGDVGAFAAAAVNGAVPEGTVYELGGPDVATFRELLETMLATTRQNRRIVAVPFNIAELQAKILSILPKPPLTVDQVELLKHDNVVSEAAVAEGRTLAAAGITPHSLAAVLPTYLWVYRRHGQFAEPGSIA